LFFHFSFNGLVKRLEDDNLFFSKHAGVHFIEALSKQNEAGVVTNFQQYENQHQNHEGERNKPNLLVPETKRYHLKHLGVELVDKLRTLIVYQRTGSVPLNDVGVGIGGYCK